MSSVVRLTKQGLIDLIDEIEAGGGDATALRRELEALGPGRDSWTRRHGARVNSAEELTMAERLNNEVGDLYLGGIISDEQMANIIDMDRNHSLKELRTMCIEAGLSPNGHKKMLAAKLLAHG